MIDLQSCMAQHSVLMTCRCLQSASPFHRAASLVRFCRMKPHAKSARMAPSEAVQRGCCSSHRTVAARDRGNSLFFLVVVVFGGFFFCLPSYSILSPFLFLQLLASNLPPDFDTRIRDLPSLESFISAAKPFIQIPSA